MGISKDKTQVTTTLCVTEAGEVLPPQLILGGGTDRCHPKDPAPHAGFYSHTPSHWQTAETMLTWIDTVLLPHKNSVISLLGLPPDQHSLLLLDLHFSHKDPTVVHHLHQHHVVPVFVPSGLTDELQVVEIACKRAFQAAARNEFRDFIQEQFSLHVDSGRLPSEFHLNFNVGFLKPLIPRCVDRGVDELHSQELHEVIVQTFAQHGRLATCRTSERAEAARLATSTFQSSSVASSTVEPSLLSAEVEGDPADSDSEDEV